MIPNRIINILIREGASGPRAREGPLEGPGGVIFPKQNVSDLFRGRKIPGTPDRRVEICFDSIENPKPPLLIRRRKVRPLIDGEHW